jgi:hypothetical protein
VAEMYKKRFHTSTFPVSPGQFDEMTRKLKEFFGQFYFKFEIAPISGPNLGAAEPAAPTRHPTAGALLPGQATKRPTASAGSAVRTASHAAVEGSLDAGLDTSEPAAPTRHPTAGALLPVQATRRLTATGGSAVRTTSHVAVEGDGATRPGRTSGSRLWMLVAAVALVAAAASGAAVYLLAR